MTPKDEQPRGQDEGRKSITVNDCRTTTMILKPKLEVCQRGL